MLSKNSLSNTNRTLLPTLSPRYRGLCLEIAERKNRHVTWSFREVHIIRGTREHPPNTDRTEVRNSLTINFTGVPNVLDGEIIAHLFSDGIIKTSTQMHQETSQRRAEEARLAAEARVMGRIHAVRVNDTLSIIAKQLEKESAMQEYRLVLQKQAEERAKAAAA
ncbi:hypothetical protein BDV19DRAFT_390874 [Aspergillus venezuelensis]